jgi:MoxR-like ATPase
MYQQNMTAPEELQQATQAIRNSLAQVIAGQEHIIDLLIAATLAGGHVLLEGMPGIAKTLMARTLAQTLSIGFSRIQFTPDLMPSDLLGTSIFNPRTMEFEFRRGPVFSNYILIDEINRAPAKTQSALFEVMEEKQITMDGITYPMDMPFMVIATQNPIDHEGTYRLPEAQSDRFMMKIRVDYPDPVHEISILERDIARAGAAHTHAIQPIITAQQLMHFRSMLHSFIHVDKQILQYIVNIVHATRSHLSLSMGASPRASLALLHCARALAAMDGRGFVNPDDIRQAALPVLRHRLILTPEREMEGNSADDIVQSLLHITEVPR